MKKLWKWLVLAVVLVGVVVGATVLYDQLSGQYDEPDLSTDAPPVSDTESDGFATPDFTVLDYDGNEVKLSDFKGKPIVVNFWATWCYFCKSEMPDFQAAYEKYPDVQFVMVNATDGVQETVDTAKAYIEDEGYTFDVFFDTEMDAVYNYAVTGFPSTFFIDAQGNPKARSSGALSLEKLEKGIAMITETEESQ